MSLKIAVVAGDPQLRQALRTLLDRERDLIVVVEGDVDALARVAAARPHVALVDADERRRDPFAVAAALAGRPVRARVLMLTGRPSVDALQAAVASGAAGVAGKMQPPRELLGAIRVVGQGGSYVCPELVTLAAASTELRAQLSPREYAVYEQLLDGRSDEAIARDLMVSLRVARTLRSRILGKLGARSAVDLVRLAARPAERTPSAG